MPAFIASLLAILLLAPLPAQAQTAAEIGQMRFRIQELEDQNRRLTGQVQQMNHHIQQLEMQLERARVAAGAAPSPSTAQVTQPTIATPVAPAAPAPVIAAPGGTGTAAGGLTALSQADSVQLGAPPQTLGQVPGRPLDLKAITQAGQAIEEQSQQFSGRIVAAPTDTPKDVYDLSYGYILRGDYASAQAGFSDFLHRFGDDPLAGNAQYWLGESHFAQGDYRLAADAFLKGYSSYPGNAKGPDSLLKLGMSLNQLGQKDAACSTYRELQQKFPGASRTIMQTLQAEIARTGC